jgi:GTPase SAR1 family protein
MFQNVQRKWVPEITRHCPNTPFIIVGVKSDSPQEQGYNLGDFQTQGQSLANDLGAYGYFECDIVSQYRLKYVFDQVRLPKIASRISQ